MTALTALAREQLPEDPAQLLSLLVDIYCDGLATGVASGAATVLAGNQPPSPDLQVAARALGQRLGHSTHADPITRNVIADMVIGRATHGRDFTRADIATEPIEVPNIYSKDQNQ